MMNTAFLLVATAMVAQPFKAPDDIAHRKADIISEGTLMSAELFALEEHAAKPLPTIVMCHGWGGTAPALRPDAIAFAKAGYFVVLFDYRGWGASDGKLVLTKPPTRG